MCNSTANTYTKWINKYNYTNRNITAIRIVQMKIIYTKSFNYTSCYINSFQLNFQDGVENFLYNSEAILRKQHENQLTDCIYQELKYKK